MTSTVVASSLLSAGVLCTGFALALAAWPVRHLGADKRIRWLAPIGLAVAALPWLVPGPPDAPVIPRLVVALGCVVLPAKLLGFRRDAPHWRDRTFLEWLMYLPNTLVLDDRRRRREPARSRANAIAWTARGLVEVIAGAALLRWSFLHDFGRGGFWLEHGVKLLACYLLLFDGGFVLATGLCRLAGLQVMDFSRDPAFAPTPAMFWRRYNRDAGRFFHDHFFVPSGGLRHPIRGIFVVFLANGMLHEYLALVMTGHLRGYQIAFFLLNGAAVAFTFRLRSRGVARIAGTAATLAFMYFSTILFFATVNEVVPWYESAAW